MRLYASASLALALVACGSSPPPRVEEPAPPPAAAPAPDTKKTEAPRADDDESLRSSYDEACKKSDAEACGKYALMAARGVGGDRDDLAAVDAASAPAAKAASGSSLRASGMTVDGTSFSSMECDLGGGGGLLGPIAIAKGVSLQKSALDACVKKPTETTVKLTSANGTFTKVEATGSDAKVNRCVEKALRGKQAAIPGTCTMTVAHGR